MSATQKVMGHVYAIFTILVWGSCFVLTKQMLTAYTAIQIIPLRMGLAYITLWALRPKTLKLPWRDELMFILIGVTGGSFYFFLQNTALTYTFAANVSIIIALSPILTVILAQLFSRNGERLGKFVYIGAVIAIAGGAGGAQRPADLPPEPSGRSDRPGRRPHVGRVLHPYQEIHRAV